MMSILENEDVYDHIEAGQCSCDTDFSDDDDLTYYTDFNDGDDEKYTEKLKKLEEEQEHLNSSLIALTSHFAQVQLRLKQIVDASSDQKEELLKELEQFAFRGIPDLREPDYFNEDKGSESGVEDVDKKCDQDVNTKFKLQRARQKQLIQKLRDQLEELEKYAYDTGESSVLPSSLLLERQTLIIDQLKGKLPLQLDHFDKSSPEELKKQVDNAIRELINPVIMKEQLVNQLQTQVTDLERFIEFLQLDPPGRPRGKRGSKCTCNCPLHGNSQRALVKKIDLDANSYIKSRFLRSIKRETKRKFVANKDDIPENRKELVSKMIKRFVTLLQLVTAQYGCNGFDPNLGRAFTKKYTKGNHWGDIRAKLEIVISKISEMNEEKSFNDSDYTSDGEECPIMLHNEKLNNVIRKEFCIALRDLIEHGLVDKLSGSDKNSIIPSYLLALSCFSSKTSYIESGKVMTAWALILRYYELKNGPQYNSCPARKLSQSFNLQIVGNLAFKPKHSLLSTIDDIIESHTKLRRSPDAHFKAFICEALNKQQLVAWLKLILKNRLIVDYFYEDWSYTASTGFEDALTSLDKLTNIKFKLPSDWAVRQLQSINDAFN